MANMKHDMGPDYTLLLCKQSQATKVLLVEFLTVVLTVLYFQKLLF